MVRPNRRTRLRNRCPSGSLGRRRSIHPARFASANGNNSTQSARLAAPEVSPPQE